MMQAIVYYVTLPFIYILAWLPFSVLYVISDLFFIVLYYVLRYRRKTVIRNLQKSYPDKNAKEIKAIEIKFYRYLCDLLLETLKTLVISKNTILKRCQLDNQALSLMQQYFNEQKSVLIVLGHYGNWEWAGNTFSLLCKQPLYVLYHPIKNKYFNNLIYNMRTRFGVRLIPMKDAYKEMIKNRNEINATAFIADQTPPPENAYWTKFLNQDTPVYWGTELIAKKLNLPVLYFKVKRMRRGYYTIYAEELIKEPAQTYAGQISELHTRKLESDIHECPEIWLWSHKRWKHTKPN